MRQQNKINSKVQQYFLIIIQNVFITYFTLLVYQLMRIDSINNENINSDVVLNNSFITYFAGQLGYKRGKHLIVIIVYMNYSYIKKNILVHNRSRLRQIILII